MVQSNSIEKTRIPFRFSWLKPVFIKFWPDWLAEFKKFLLQKILFLFNLLPKRFNLVFKSIFLSLSNFTWTSNGNLFCFNVSLSAWILLRWTSILSTSSIIFFSSCSSNLYSPFKIMKNPIPYSQTFVISVSFRNRSRCNRTSFQDIPIPNIRNHHAPFDLTPLINSYSMRVLLLLIFLLDTNLCDVSIFSLINNSNTKIAMLLWRLPAIFHNFSQIIKRTSI